MLEPCPTGLLLVSLQSHPKRVASKKARPLKFMGVSQSWSPFWLTLGFELQGMPRLLHICQSAVHFSFERGTRRAGNNSLNCRFLETRKGIEPYWTSTLLRQMSDSGNCSPSLFTSSGPSWLGHDYRQDSGDENITLPTADESHGNKVVEVDEILCFSVTITYGENEVCGKNW